MMNDHVVEVVCVLTTTCILTIAPHTICVQYSELTPNKTRRAQCANWLLYYREELFGYTLEELQERKRLKKEAEAAKDPDNTEWKPPVTEVF